jgi:hypothetical protein
MREPGSAALGIAARHGEGTGLRWVWPPSWDHPFASHGTASEAAGIAELRGDDIGCRIGDLIGRVIVQPGRGFQRRSEESPSQLLDVGKPVLKSPNVESDWQCAAVTFQLRSARAVYPAGELGPCYLAPLLLSQGRRRPESLKTVQIPATAAGSRCGAGEQWWEW